MSSFMGCSFFGNPCIFIALLGECFGAFQRTAWHWVHLTKGGYALTIFFYSLVRRTVLINCFWYWAFKWFEDVLGGYRVNVLWDPNFCMTMLQQQRNAKIVWIKRSSYRGGAYCVRRRRTLPNRDVTAGCYVVLRFLCGICLAFVFGMHLPRFRAAC